jgi:hypothetical protein
VYADYLRHDDDLAAEAEALLERGWLEKDADERPWLTADGEQAASTRARTPRDPRRAARRH